MVPDFVSRKNTRSAVRPERQISRQTTQMFCFTLINLGLPAVFLLVLFHTGHEADTGH